MIQPGLGTEPFSFPEKKGGGPCGSSETTEINRAEKKLWEEERPAQGEGVLLPTGSWEAGAGGGEAARCRGGGHAWDCCGALGV